jgi:hypothetical protein
MLHQTQQHQLNIESNPNKLSCYIKLNNINNNIGTT